MAKKRGKKFAGESFPSCSLFPVCEETKARSRYQSLLQDYEELRKETESRKKQLQKANQRKLKLLAEVKFLKRKYTFMSKNPSGITQCRLKKRPENNPSQLIHNGQSSNVDVQIEVCIREMALPVREDAVPSTLSVIDLNQNAEELEFQDTWEPLKMDALKKCSMEGDAMVNDLKLPICRDVGNGANQGRKRKIRWQDQVALSLVSSLVQHA